MSGKQLVVFLAFVILGPCVSGGAFSTLAAQDDAPAFWGWLAAGASLFLSFALLQAQALVFGAYRLVRRLLGDNKALDAPPGRAVEVLLAILPVFGATTVYALATVLQSIFLGLAHPSAWLLLPLLGTVLGVLVAVSFFRNLLDLDDIDVLGAHGGPDVGDPGGGQTWKATRENKPRDM